MKFPKMCPRCFADYDKLIRLKDGQIICNKCITLIELPDVTNRDKREVHRLLRKTNV